MAKKKTGLFGGLLGIAEKGISGTAKRMAEEEAKALGKPKKPKIDYEAREHNPLNKR